MRDDERELPVAVLRPGLVRGQASATRGDMARWAQARGRSLRGPKVGFVLCGLVFGSMLLVMGHAADRSARRNDSRFGYRPTPAAPAATPADGAAPADPWAASPELARTPGDGTDHLGGVLRYFGSLPATVRDP